MTGAEDLRDRACSFCGRTGHEVKVFIAGVTGNICGECVGLAMEMIAAEYDLAEFEKLVEGARKAALENKN